MLDKFIRLKKIQFVFEVFIIFAIFAAQIILDPIDDEREKHKDC